MYKKIKWKTNNTLESRDKLRKGTLKKLFRLTINIKKSRVKQNSSLH